MAGLFRQQLQPSDRIHHVVTKGWSVANIIPDYIESQWGVRGNTRQVAPMALSLSILPRLQMLTRGQAPTRCRPRSGPVHPLRLRQRHQHHRRDQGLPGLLGPEPELQPREHLLREADAAHEPSRRPEHGQLHRVVSRGVAQRRFCFRVFRPRQRFLVPPGNPGRLPCRRRCAGAQRGLPRACRNCE